MEIDGICIWELRRLVACREYILTHLDKDLRLPVLSRETGVPAQRLNTVFCRVYGLSLHQYIIRQKMSKVRELIETTDQPLKAIASAVGYRPRNLYKTYKKFYGETPGRLRFT